MNQSSKTRSDHRRSAVAWAATALACTLALTACSAGAEPTVGAATSDAADGSAVDSQETTSAESVDARFTVVTSDPPIADLVSQVAGEDVKVVSIVPMGADGHTYEPVPSDARVLAETFVYIENGMGLNDVVSAFAAANFPQGTLSYALADAIPPDEIIYMDTAEQIEAHGHAHSANAHFWPDPNYAVLYVREIAEILAVLDRDEADAYRQRAEAFVQELEAMDATFETVIATIPDENRKLVVYHDSWSYFGRRYEIPVIGAIQPTDFAEPSAAEVRATIEQVREAGVPAFFGSEVFPSSVLSNIESETGAQYVADLSDDAFPGEPGSPEHSYVGMMVENVRTIVTALGGDPSALDSIELTP